MTACHVLNRVPTKNKEITPFEEWEKKRLKLSYLRTWGCLAKVNVPIPKKIKLGPKTVDCVFLGYAFHSIGYRFLIVKSEVPDMHVGTIMESNDATFFEDIFPMKDNPSSSSQEMPSSSSQDLATIPEPTISMEHYDNPVEDNNEAPKRSKRQMIAKSLVMISLCISWMTLPILFQKPMHLLMLTTGRRMSVARWILSWLMELGRSLIVLMGANL